VDRLTAFVVVANLKLRLKVLTLYPDSLEAIIMADKPSLYIPRPVELAGMRSRLMRAQQQGKDIAKTGIAYDEVMDGIDEAHAAIKGHVGDLTLLESSLRSQIMGMLERSNGAPTDGESDGRQSSSGQDEKSETKPDVKADITAVAVPALASDAAKATAATLPPASLVAAVAPEVPPVAPGTASEAAAPANGAAAPEQVTVNGVSVK
jgi:hypothetical protein